MYLYLAKERHPPDPSRHHPVSTFTPSLEDNSSTPLPFSSAQAFTKDNLDMKLSSPRDENNFHWVNATTKNGKAFRIGYPRPGRLVEREDALALDNCGADATWYPVNWPVGDSSWKEVTNVPQLTKYALYEQSIPRIYTYALSVYLTNTGFGTTYTFEDQTGDEYSLTVFRDGEHSVDFDSDEPRIKRVKTDQEF